jgi:hypothetical protein
VSKDLLLLFSPNGSLPQTPADSPLLALAQLRYPFRRRIRLNGLPASQLPLKPPLPVPAIHRLPGFGATYFPLFVTAFVVPALLCQVWRVIQVNSLPGFKGVPVQMAVPGRGADYA